MSSTVGNNPTVATYQAPDATTQSTQSATASTSSAVTEAQQATAAWQAGEADSDKEDLARNALLGNGLNFGQSFGADDDDSTKALHSIKQGAHQAGVVLSDKTMHDVHGAVQNDPGTKNLVGKLANPQDADTQKLVGSLQTGGKADLTMFKSAYETSPAASLPAAGAANAAAGAAGTAATGTAAATAPAGSTGSTGSASAGVSATGTAATGATATTASSPSGPATGPGHLSGGNWSAYIALAMFGATKEMQTEKKNELNQIKKYNSMLDGLNTYVTTKLMPAQQELQTRIANATGNTTDNTNKFQVTIYNPIHSLDTTNAGQDPVTGAAILQNAPGTAAPPVAEKVTQNTLSSYIEQANQWRTSISNNQQLHSSNFQSLDTQVTSFLNMITTLYKNVSDTQSSIARNLPT